MGFLPAERLPDDPERLALRKDAQTTLQAYQEFLRQPAFQHRVDIKVLTAIAGDASMPPRERRRAAEMLGTLYLKALEKVAELSCAREQALNVLGIDTGAKAVAVAQVVNKIEIVREADWRSGAEIVEGTPHRHD
jgi:hypothetical protein